jgi:hypothetical protein
VLEVFDLFQSLLGFLFGSVWAAQIFALLGQNFVAATHFLDHESPPRHYDRAQKQSRRVWAEIILTPPESGWKYSLLLNWPDFHPQQEVGP